MILQAQNAQEESQRMTAMRKTYQKAVITPTHHVEQLWRDYENFENSVSRQLVNLCFWIVSLVIGMCLWMRTSPMFMNVCTLDYKPFEYTVNLQLVILLLDWQCDKIYPYSLWQNLSGFCLSVGVFVLWL